jgi:integrase
MEEKIVKKKVLVSPTKFMIELKERLITERKVGESTANTYIANLTRLNEGKMFSTLGFLKSDYDRIQDILKEKEIENRITYLSSINASLWLFRDGLIYKKLFVTYNQQLQELIDEKDERDAPMENKKTEKQEENWLDWKEIMAKYDELSRRVNEFKNNLHINRSQYTDLMRCLLLSLYTQIEPRRSMDYTKMWIKTGNGTRGATIDEKECNIYDVREQKMIFRIYKTSKFYGETVIHVPDSLADIISVWMRFHPSLTGVKHKPQYVRLIVNMDGTIPRDNFITLKLNQIFDAKIGVSMLRHIFISEKFGPEMQEMSRVAAAMGHSTTEQRSYAKFD